MASANLVLVYELAPPIPMTCADGTGIAKGAALKLSGALTVVTCTAADDKFGGVAAEEKIANAENLQYQSIETEYLKQKQAVQA